MSDQPTAMQLAAQLDDELVRTVEVDMLYHQAAAELRRMHDQIEALEAANEAFGQRQVWWNERMVTLEQKVEADEALLRQALEALTQSEPTTPYEGFGMARREAERKHESAIFTIRVRLQEKGPPGEGGPKLRGRQQEESPGKDNGSL
jgi:hypothetical protein